MTTTPYRRPTLDERYPVDHRDPRPQLPHEIQSSIGEPYTVAGGCNCAECVQARMRNAPGRATHPTVPDIDMSDGREYSPSKAFDAMKRLGWDDSDDQMPADPDSRLREGLVSAVCGVLSDNRNDPLLNGFDANQIRHAAIGGVNYVLWVLGIDKGVVIP